MAEDEKKEPEQKPQISLAELYDKIKSENDRAEAILKRNEELAARNLLSGKSDSVLEPEKPKPSEGMEYLQEIKKRFS